MVTIAADLEVWNAVHLCNDRVPCRIALPRWAFPFFLPKEMDGIPGALLVQFPSLTERGKKYTVKLHMLAVWCSIAVWRVVHQGSPTRKKTISLLVTRYPPVRFMFSRTSLPIFARFFANPTESSSSGLKEKRSFKERVRMAPPLWDAALSISSSPPWQHMARLTEEIKIWLLPEESLLRVAYPPRGSAVTIFPGPEDISSSLFACDMLVNGFRQCSSEEQKDFAVFLRAAFKERPEIEAYAQQYKSSPGALAVALASRRFFRLRKNNTAVKLLAKSPQEIFRRYNNKGQFKVYSDALVEIASELPLFEAFYDSWYDTYLFPPSLR
jgi:hypothetical protein